jgi:hypothetical protein
MKISAPFFLSLLACAKENGIGTTPALSRKD